MPWLRSFLLFVLFFSAGSVLAEEATSSSLSSQPKSLVAFSSEQELNAWLLEKKALFALKMSPLNLSESENKPQESEMAASPQMELGRAAEDESITSTQTAGVDEGGIVKQRGDFLIILRRGRLFTIKLQGEKLTPAFFTDAFTPGQGRGGWYDELLVSGNTVVVIGYSYTKGGTEIILFHMDEAGQLSYQATYILRSNDYYSSRNYASRLIGQRLIFYTPLYLDFYRNPLDSFPALRRWDSPGKNADFKRIAPATRIFRVDDEAEVFSLTTLHTVQVCDLSGKEMTCEATAVLGPAGREFYVSQKAVYVWTVNPLYWNKTLRSPEETLADSAVFRLPLEGKGNPSALKTQGSPIDQFSFHESGGYLNVLLRAEGRTASMWASEMGRNDLALFRVPIKHFGDGKQSASPDSYHPLPLLDKGSLQNRYIGDYLVYGVGNTWLRGNTLKGGAYALKWKTPDIPAIPLPVAHTIDRIEALGAHALLVGTRNNDLYFSPVVLPGDDRKTEEVIRLKNSFKLPNAAQGETRSHGFFYKPENRDNGILGLPFVGARVEGWRQLRETSSGVVFVKNDQLELKKLGILGASRKVRQEDRCQVSCVDWYGNSRPIFLRGRIFALMGYELVEGALIPSDRGDLSLSEKQRVDFTPRFAPRKKR